MRRQLAENIVIVGGTAMAKGLKARLQEELLSLIKEERYSKKLFVSQFKFHCPPALENYVAWLGGNFSLFIIFILNNYLVYLAFLDSMKIFNFRFNMWSY